MNDIRVLLVESEIDDARFIREALAEAEESTHCGTWVHYEVTQLERSDDAAVVLENEPPDVVLFSPNLADNRNLDTYGTLRDAAPGVPLIVLLNAGEEGLGWRLLRLGAQDFMVKSEIDCRPLARSVLNAIERQRYQRGAQLASLVDLETGFYNADAFRTIAARDLHLAAECARPVTLLLAEIDDLDEVERSCGRQSVHELVRESANVIRHGMRESDLAGRTALGQFAMLTWRNNADELIARVQNGTSAGYHSFAFVFGYSFALNAGNITVEELFSTAQGMLYENKQAFSSVS